MGKRVRLVPIPRMLVISTSLVNQNCCHEIKRRFNVKKKHLVFPVLLLILSVVLIVSYATPQL